MINMEALPPRWVALLSRVKIRLDCSAVIARGAIRDLLLAEEPVKDLDIFVLDPSVRDLGKLTSAYGEAVHDERSSASLEQARGPTERFADLLKRIRASRVSGD
jgi:hypothetical protein